MDANSVESIVKELGDICKRIDSLIAQLQNKPVCDVVDHSTPPNGRSTLTATNVVPCTETTSATSVIPCTKTSTSEQMEFFTQEQYETFHRNAGLRGGAGGRKNAALEDTEESSRSKSAARHIAISKHEAFRRFHKRTEGKEIIHLGDVNEIFGYNRSTSGRFIRDAIKDGKLKTIEYGSGKKFLVRDVRSFLTKVFS